MREACGLPVTVKHRIGFDERDRYEDMLHFIDVVADAGCTRFTVHARKAWLQGLSPKQNRNVPPLRYEEVHRLARELPDVPIEINGGFVDLDAVADQLEHVDAVMIGRGVWHDPWLLADVDRRFFGETGPAPTREDVLEDWIPFVERRVAEGHKIQHVVRHAGPIYAGQPGAKAFKRALARAHKEGSKAILEGIEAVRLARAAWSERKAG